jgi:aspartate carbamoyltransferase catalytic subunit
MPSSKSSLIDLKSYSPQEVSYLFSSALRLKKNFNQHSLSSGVYHSGYKGTAALLFFEPSTRTRFSFEAACSRAGYHPLILDGGLGTSLEKGETIEDTIFNIQALRPRFFVIRCDEQVNLQDISGLLSVPTINAGWGRRGHPTQALLDALSIYELQGELTNKHVLFVGDVKHSRVVSSHIELSRVAGYQIGVCAPEEFRREEDPHVIYFSELNEALQWADAVIALRVQKERHDNENLFFTEDYRDSYSLNMPRLSHLKPQALIMHPGPINYGVEIEKEVLQDKRCIILGQVENGVFLREALIRQLFSSDKGGENEL